MNTGILIARLNWRLFFVLASHSWSNDTYNGLVYGSSNCYYQKSNFRKLKSSACGYIELLKIKRVLQNKYTNVFNWQW